MSTKKRAGAPARRARERRGGEPEGGGTRGGVLLAHDLGFTVLVDAKRFREDGVWRTKLDGQGLRLVPEADSDGGDRGPRRSIASPDDAQGAARCSPRRGERDG